MNCTIRPLGAMEKLFWLLDESSSVHFIVAAEISGKKSNSEWQSALDAVQLRHPLLSASINSNGFVHPFFQEEKNASIPLRVATQNGKTRWEDEVARELATPFDSGKAPLLRAVLVETQQKTILILVIHHSIGDGLSSLVVLNDLLRSLSGQLLLPLDVPDPAEELLGIVQAEDGRTDPQTTFTRRKEDRPVVEFLQLSQSFTSQLSDNCRKEGTTVHGALCAAFVFAGRSIENEWKKNPVRLVSPAAIRKELITKDVVGQYIISKTIVYPVETEEGFWELARFSKKELQGISSRENISTAINAASQRVFSEKSTMEIADALQQGVSREIMITNLGRYPYPVEFVDLRLDAVWGPSVLSGFRGDQTIGIVTVNGAMCLVHTSRIPVKGLLAMAEKVLQAAIN